MPCPDVGCKQVATQQGPIASSSRFCPSILWNEAPQRNRSGSAQCPLFEHFEMHRNSQTGIWEHRQIMANPLKLTRYANAKHSKVRCNYLLAKFQGVMQMIQFGKGPGNADQLQVTEFLRKICAIFSCYLQESCARIPREG